MKRFLIIPLLICFHCLTLYSQPNDPLKRPLPNLPFHSPKEAGLNSDSLSKLIQLITDVEEKDFRGLIILKDQKIVQETYFNNYWRETIHDIRSAGKSITALLMGIAIDQGFVGDVNQKVVDFFPEFRKNLPKDDPKRAITIHHLLMMSSGLDADAYNSSSPGNEQYLFASDDWIEFALSLPRTFEAGEKYTYNSVCAMLTGAIIEEASGKKLEDFANVYLFEPLGIQEYYWYTGPHNRNSGMGNLYISTLDFAKIGQLLINQGVWADRRIVNKKWIQQMLSKRFSISDQDIFADNYGYMWYQATREVNGRDFSFWFASGNGGNHLYIVPEWDIVVSITSSAYGQGYGHFRSRNIFKYVLKCVD